jgi:uncharacterized protein with HEPN domain
MRKDPNILLFDVLDSIEKIEEYTGGISKSIFFDKVQI